MWHSKVRDPRKSSFVVVDVFGCCWCFWFSCLFPSHVAAFQRASSCLWGVCGPKTATQTDNKIKKHPNNVRDSEATQCTIWETEESILWYFDAWTCVLFFLPVPIPRSCWFPVQICLYMQHFPRIGMLHEWRCMHMKTAHRILYQCF